MEKYLKIEVVGEDDGVAKAKIEMKGLNPIEVIGLCNGMITEAIGKMKPADEGSLTKPTMADIKKVTN